MAPVRLAGPRSSAIGSPAANRIALNSQKTSKLLGGLVFLGLAIWFAAWSMHSAGGLGGWQRKSIASNPTPACPACTCTAGQDQQQHLCPEAQPCPACPACAKQQPCPSCPAQQPAASRGGCDEKGKYDLSHLNQVHSQAYIGPIQDDEALLLYALVRGMRMSRVLELGGLRGYSAANFLAAMQPTQGVVYTVDVKEVQPRHETQHRVLQKDAGQLTPADVDNEPLDLVFFDCHVVESQMKLYRTLSAAGIITNRTILALHDTNTHPYNSVQWAYETEQGWVHQKEERIMVGQFHDMGYDALMLHPPHSVHSRDLPFRHGLTIMSRYTKLLV